MKRESVYRIFSNIPELKTERLVLRKMLVKDADDMFEYARRADVTKYLTWSPHPSRAYTKEYLEYIATRYAAGEFYDWAVTDARTGKMIGTCGFTKFDFMSNSAEVGYVLNPVFWGHGYACEALEAVLNFGFCNLKLNRIEARYMEGNIASRRVMEKSGMKYEGMFRQSLLIHGEYRNVCVCSILNCEYIR
jgi:ribosomal-protein-alanine N-acetyltransferase